MLSNWCSCRLFLSSTIVAAAFIGCSTESDHATVAGTVTLDGEPLESGIIRFVPTDGQSPTADATITAGKFSAKVPLGEKRVTISASKVVGKRKMYDTADSPTVDVVEERVPPRYNAQSDLTLNVECDSRPAQFDLKSK